MLNTSEQNTSVPADSRLKKIFKSPLIRMLVGWPILVTLIFSLPVGYFSGLGYVYILKLTLLLIGQNFAFTIVSRARQSSSLQLHTIAALASNGFFIFIITLYAANYDNNWMKFWYMVCTTVGSVYAHHISLHKLEKMKSFEKDAMVSRRDLELAVEQAIEKMRQELSLAKA